MAEKSYRLLDAQKVITTIDTLHLRIEDRFPGRGILDVAKTLCRVARIVASESVQLNKPHWGLRAVVGFVMALGTLMFLYVGTLVNFSNFSTEATAFVQLLEQVINTVVLVGLGLAFLISMETRLKRRRALKDLHELRSVVHVIDMHQLTKDPSVFLADRTTTTNSPDETLTRFEMVRYLDYCAEMLALSAKLAALYAQNMDDSVVVNAVNDVEMLASTLSGKIWQKIAILEDGHFGVH